MFRLKLNDAAIKSLSPNELNVLKYVYGHSEEVLNMSIHELSRNVAYSSSTILRLCKKLGFSGFAEMKYTLRAEMNRKPPNEPVRTDYNVERIFDNLYTDIEGTASLIQPEQLIKTFKYFDSSRSIFLWAPSGITAIVAEYFEKLLLSIGRQNVYIMESMRMTEHVFRTRGSNAVLILISASGDFAPTIKIGKIACMNNIPVISITPYSNNKIADLASVSFRFFVRQRENKGAEFTSRLPAIYIINMIMQCYLKYRQFQEGNE